ncbi:MAG TPA: hypothetical protein VEZ40_19190 [Pyrinomonadaceae bacterium]|nr:hypothetical protein [Pyrinomonadaceae bacterium]
MIRTKARATVLKLITPFFASQPYLIEKKGEAVNYSIKNRPACLLYKTLPGVLRLRFSINQFERFETLHSASPLLPAAAQF